MVSLAIGAAVVGLTLRRAMRGPSGANAAADHPTGLGRDFAGLHGAAAQEADGPLPELAPEEEAHYRARLAAELAQRERGPA